MTTPESPAPTEEARALAQRFYVKQVLEALIDREVVFTRDVDRVDFIIKAGATGVMQAPFTSDGLLVAAVLLNDPPRACRAFDGEVHWMEDVNLIDFEDEVALA